jgi:hypothetical protein
MNERLADLSLAQVLELLAVFVAVGVACFYLMLFAFAQFTGWRALAARYRDRGHEIAPYRAGSTVIGPHAFSSPPLNVGIDDSGLTLRPAFPFRPVFAPLHIPWSEIVRADRRKRMFFEVLELHCGRDGKTVVGFLPSVAADAIAAHLRVEVAPAG